MIVDRRTVIAASAATLLPAPAPAAPDPVARYRTPYKLGRLVLGGTGRVGDFDEKLVDCPFVFRHGDGFRMLYVGWDGIGYQSGLADSGDMLTWRDRRCVLPRDPRDPVVRYNIAMNWILREPQLFSPGRLERVGGRYVGAWHAYPGAGYEEGPAVIGLAFSDDLERWERTRPILRPDPDAAWEAGGLYKPCLIRDGDTFYLFYNAKTTEKGDWREQTGVAMSRDLKTWTRHPGNPILPVGPAGGWDDRFASDPCVLRDREKWVMFYFGLTYTGVARDLVAVGAAPTRLTKMPEILVDVGAQGAIDDRYAHKPSLIAHRGDLYHFYTAVRATGAGEVRGISVARSRPWTARQRKGDTR